MSHRGVTNSAILKFEGGRPDLKKCKRIITHPGNSNSNSNRGAPICPTEEAPKLPTFKAPETPLFCPGP